MSLDNPSALVQLSHCWYPSHLVNPVPWNPIQTEPSRSCKTLATESPVKPRFESMIRQTVRLGEAPLVGRPVTAYATNSEAARAYRGLAREVIELG